MSKAAFPTTPFSTPLSGSSKEAEERIRSIFQYKKKRPPILFFLLACALALLCGGLVSCDAQASAGSLSQEEETLLSLLAAEDQAVWEEGDEPRLLACIQQDNYLLGAAACSHRFGDTLLIGVMDVETGALTGPAYQQQVYYGTPYVTTFQQNGEDFLLYTHNGMHQGVSNGSAGLVAFRGDDFTWTWPVEGDLREEGSQASAGYEAYWEDHLALLAPGGVDVFTETDNDVLRGEGPQWTVDHNENFYLPEEGDLPIPIPYQTRVWVENFTRDRNALSAGNRSALYHIVSMQAEEPVPGQGDGDSLYSLLAFCNGRGGEGESGWLSAVLLFDEGTGQVGDVLAWAQGDREEVTLPRERWANLEGRNQLIAEYYQNQGYSPVYLPGDPTPDILTKSALAIESILYGDEMANGEMVTLTYQVTFQNQDTDRAPVYLALQKNSADGSFVQVLGQEEPVRAGKSALDMAFQETFGLMDADASLLYDGSSPPVGLGDWREPSYLSQGEAPTLEILEGWEPIYNPGDYWERWSVEGFTALRYYHASEGYWTVHSLETTRTDLHTYRGIRVGDSRSSVQALYPNLRDEDYWHLYDSAEEDFLWCCAGPDDPNDFGPALLFFFEDDHVSRIVLYNMFD